MSFELLPLNTKLEIDQICDAFEDAWHKGKGKRIEAFLSWSSEPDKPDLFRELLSLELELRSRSGEKPLADDYLARFPGYASIIRSEFEAQAIATSLPFLAPASTEPGTGIVRPSSLERTEPQTTHSREPGETGGAVCRTNRSIPPPPEWIGRYRVLELLGQGNFLVYLAHDDEEDRKVAVKVSRPGDDTAWRRMMSLAVEARRLDALEHPSIVKMYEYVPPSLEDHWPEGGGYLVLEYVEGPTLSRVLKEGTLSPPHLAELIARVADAVHHAHTSGVFHRDLKPPNILVDRNNNPRVCDFGLAIEADAQSGRFVQVAGTIPYMAPEQVRGEVHRIDGRTDIWALGVILYQGLTRKDPFPGVTDQERFDEILERDPGRPG